MTLKNKTLLGLGTAGLIGVLVGITGQYRTLEKAEEVRTPAVDRIIKIGNITNSINMNTLLSDIALRDRYLTLQREYDALRSKPMVREEYERFTAAMEGFGQRMAGYTLAAVIGAAFAGASLMSYRSRRWEEKK